MDGRKGYRVDGGKVMVFGDLHLSSSYTGKHKNYTLECFENMERILSLVKEESPSAVVFLGDIVGVNERNIRDRQFLMRVVMFFGMLYNITNGNVFAVRGNHDMGDFPDYDFILGLGYIKNPRYVDYYSDSGVKEIRFHFVNYGNEGMRLDIDKDGASNIVFGHADYYIDGVTTWYSDKKGRVELKTLKNFIGVDMVFSGHIHIPSSEVLYTNLPDGENIGLFYLGSPSRTAERYDDCWYVTFEYQKESLATTYDANYFGLKPSNEVFYDDSEFEHETEELDNETSNALEAIAKEIFESRLATGDIFGQIDRIPADNDCKELAKDYLRKAIDGGM